MIKGYDDIKEKIIDIRNKGFEATNKEGGTLESLSVALEMAARGLKVLPFDLYKSKAMTFDVADDKSLIPPFITIDGLGETVAKNIENEAKKHPLFQSKISNQDVKFQQLLLIK